MDSTGRSATRGGRADDHEVIYSTDAAAAAQNVGNVGLAIWRWGATLTVGIVVVRRGRFGRCVVVSISFRVRFPERWNGHPHSPQFRGDHFYQVQRITDNCRFTMVNIRATDMFRLRPSHSASRRAVDSAKTSKMAPTKTATAHGQRNMLEQCDRSNLSSFTSFKSTRPYPERQSCTTSTANTTSEYLTRHIVLNTTSSPLTPLQLQRAQERESKGRKKKVRE